MDNILRIQISEDGADAALLSTLTGYLRTELLALDVDDVTAPKATEPPPGARAVDATVVGGLLVTLGQSADALRSVISVINAWLARGQRSQRSVRIVLGADTLELSQASVADQDRLMELFVSQHTGRSMS